MVEVPVVVMTDAVQMDEPSPYDADAAYVAGWIRGFAVGEALAAQEPYEPPIVEPASKSES